LADYSRLVTSFKRSLQAENKAVRTVEAYEDAALRLAAFLVEHGLPTSPSDIRRPGRAAARRPRASLMAGWRLSHPQRRRLVRATRLTA
jgi:hypothetical protein